MTVWFRLVAAYSTVLLAPMVMVFVSEQLSANVAPRT